MGCTPSILHHYHHHQSTTTSNNNNHRNGPAEEGARVTPDITGNSTHLTTGSASSPRSLGLFRRVKIEKTTKSNKSASQAVQNQIGTPGGFSLTNQEYTTKVLLAFGKDDVLSDAFVSACEKLGYECNLGRSREAVLETFQTRIHEIVIVDIRNPKIFDGESICRALRGLKTTQYTVVVGVVRRSTSDKEDSSVEPLLSMGFNRVCVETSSVTQCMNELLQLYVSDVQPRLQLAAAQAMYVALDKCSDVVHITDQNLNVQYMNRSSERFLGFSMKDAAGKSLLETNSVDNKELMVQQLQRGREWEGLIT